MPRSPPAEHVLLGKLVTVLPLGAKQLRARASVGPRRRGPVHTGKPESVIKGQFTKVWQRGGTSQRTEQDPQAIRGKREVWVPEPEDRAVWRGLPAWPGETDWGGGEHGYADLTLLPSLISC